MTLREMAVEYRVNCARLKGRMDWLMADLTALYREGRELALHMERYYDRRYCRHAKFTF